MKTNKTRTLCPDDNCIEKGAKYAFIIDRESPKHSCGGIWDEFGTIRWRYERRPCTSGYRLNNPFCKPDFVVKDSESKEILLIRRASLIPSLFNIIEKNIVIGKISMCSILRNSYRINLNGKPSWTFHMPLFTVRFWGESDIGSRLWVICGPSKMQWNLLMEPGIDNVQILSALAFIHNEWWNYS